MPCHGRLSPEVPALLETFSLRNGRKGREGGEGGVRCLFTCTCLPGTGSPAGGFDSPLFSAAAPGTAYDRPLEPLNPPKKDCDRGSSHPPYKARFVVTMRVLLTSTKSLRNETLSQFWFPSNRPCFLFNYVQSTLNYCIHPFHDVILPKVKFRGPVNLVVCVRVRAGTRPLSYWYLE